MLSDYTVAVIPVNLVPILWDDLLPHIAKALNSCYGEANADTIKNRLLVGNYFAITINLDSDIVAVVTARIDTYDTKLKSLVIMSVGSASELPMDEWGPPFMPVIKQLAIELGCDQIRSTASRRGWSKWAKKQNMLGWEEAYYTYVLNIGD